ncbi:MAG: hypothetical protein ACYDCG_10585 [Candidatus Acidiferrales bacterium]
MDLETYAFDLLQIGDDLKQIARLRVAAGSERAHQAFRGAVGRVAQFGKADGGVDEIAKNDLAGFQVTGKKVRREISLSAGRPLCRSKAERKGVGLLRSK